MKRIGIIGENFKNDACAFKALIAPQYNDQIALIPIGPGLSGGDLPVKTIIAEIARAIKKERLEYVLIIRDLDNDEKRAKRYRWFENVKKGAPIESLFYLAVMELEALILSDIDTFNRIYGIKGQYTKNPMFEKDPKRLLRDRTSQAKRQYHPNHALEIFSELQFDVVYRKHKGEDSFQAFIDDFEEKFKLKPTTKERLKKGRGKG